MQNNAFLKFCSYEIQLNIKLKYFRKLWYLVIQEIAEFGYSFTLINVKTAEPIGPNFFTKNLEFRKNLQNLFVMFFNNVRRENAQG